MRKWEREKVKEAEREREEWVFFSTCEGSAWM